LTLDCDLVQNCGKFTINCKVLSPDKKNFQFTDFSEKFVSRIIGLTELDWNGVNITLGAAAAASDILLIGSIVEQHHQVPPILLVQNVTNGLKTCTNRFPNEICILQPATATNADYN
jgi:hypothetical protein